jgi:hypothetical protein
MPALAAPVDLAEVTSAAYRSANYPDWDEGVLREAGAVEQKRGDGGIDGLVTISVSQDAWVSVLYYSSSGRGYRMLDELLVPTRHHTTAVYPLPPGDDGLTRLIVWDTRPKPSLLDSLALAPVQANRRIADLVAEQWFPRSRPQPAQVWLDERQRIQPLPLQFFLSREPYAAATLGTDDVVRARNCAVTFRGLTLVDNDIWGSFGQWQLGVGNKLQVSVPLRNGMGLRQAELRIQGQQAVATRGQTGIELDVNGWRTTEVPLQAGVGELELLSFDVSHDLEPGMNTLSLRTSSAGSNWLLRSIELWIE